MQICIWVLINVLLHVHIYAGIYIGVHKDQYRYIRRLMWGGHNLFSNLSCQKSENIKF